MKKGFTLIEMLTVVLIIAVLTGIAVPQYRRAIQKANATEGLAMLRTLYDTSERLAAEMGYRSYQHLYSATYATNQKKSGLARMDMFGNGQSMKGCSIPANLSYELRCKKFTYSLTPGNGRYIKAIKKGTYKNTLLIFDRETQNVYCQNPAGENKVCDIFGLDTIEGSF